MFGFNKGEDINSSIINLYTNIKGNDFIKTSRISHLLNNTAMKFTYHHLGIPTNIIQPDERYSEKFKMYTSDHKGHFKVQFHRIADDSPLHPVIKSLPHIAFQVEDLSEALKDKEILLEPYEPIAGYRVAIINDGGVPVEFVETRFTDEELWMKARQQNDLNTEGLSL